MGQKETLRLVQKAAAGNRKAFERLCSEQGQSVLYLCIKYMGNLHDGEDAAQEVFIKLQKKITDLKSPEAFIVWLQRLVYTTCNDVRRRNMKYNGMAQLDDYADMLPEKNLDSLPAEYLNGREKREELLEIIDSLPEAARSCVLLYYYEGMKTPEIATVLGVSENAVNIQLHRARLKIRTVIETRDSQAYAMSSALLPMGALGGLLQAEAALLAPAASVAASLSAVGIAFQLAAGAAVSLAYGKLTAIVSALVALAAAGCLWFYLGPAQADSTAPQPQPGTNDPQHSSPAVAASEEYPAAAPEDPAGGQAPAPAGPPAGDPASSVTLIPGSPGRPGGVIDPGRPATPGSTSTYTPPAEGVILGQVTSSAGGLPAGLEVELSAPDGQTYLAAVSTDGSFSFAGKASAAAGTYTARLLLPAGSGYVAARGSASFEAGQGTVSIALSVSPAAEERPAGTLAEE